MLIGIDGHTIGGRYGGNESYVVNLVRALPDACGGDELIVYVTRPEAVTIVRDLHPALRPVRMLAVPPVARIPLTFPWRLWRDRVDVVHVQYFQPPVCPCRVVSAVHDIAFERFPQTFSPTQRLYMRTLIPLLARRADAVLTVSLYSKDDICERYGIPAERVHAIPVSHDPAYRPVVDGDRLVATRKRHSLPERFVLFVSRLDPRKNLTGLLEAMSRLGPHYGDVGLVVVGKKGLGYLAAVERMRELGLEPRVHFTGYVPIEEIVDLYNLADVFVYPSFFEGFGMPPLEAMACGAPVVASNVTSIPEVVGDAGLLIDPGDSDAVADAIRRVLDDEELAAELRAKGLARAAEFSWERTARETYRVYRAVTGEL